MTATIPTIPRGDTLPADSDARSSRMGPIVVASDGTEFSVPALEAAFEISRRTKAVVRVVAVLEAHPDFAYEYGALSALPELLAGMRDHLLVRVRAQLADLGHGAEWTIDLRDGDPATEIVRVGNEISARLLILGVRHRGIVERLLGRETSLRALRWSDVPILVVPEGFSSAPARMLVATDLSPGSVLAARTALEIFNTIAHVDLVHVAPSARQVPSQVLPQPISDRDVQLGFDRVAMELGKLSRATVKSVRLEGRPSNEILYFARTHDVDLIVTGSRGAGFIDRLFRGSTSRRLVRGVPCAVLVVRLPAHLDVPYSLLEPDQEPIPFHRWVSELQAFTTRNIGRLVSIEVDDPEFGAQAQVRDYPLLGVTFDHQDHRVQIMVGDSSGAERHLTRGVSNPRSIHILRDPSGRDWIFCIAHGIGQTILTLDRTLESSSDAARN